MNIFRKIYYALSPTLRFWARRMYYLPYDLYATVTKKRGECEPPKGLIFIGSGDFKEQGRHLMELVVKMTGLKPDGKILDIGCGIGRLAVPLTNYLNSDGVYEGFDIVPLGINWCRKHISPKYPNFHFLCVALKNDLYNLDTEEKAAHFCFPYVPNMFDSIVLTSVFTHMMPEDVKQYLQQIALVMKRDGKCLATFFILNSDSEQAMAEKRSAFTFENKYDGYRLMDANVKEANVAYEQDSLFSMIHACGLEVDSFHVGKWADGKEALDFQDVVILKKQSH